MACEAVNIVKVDSQALQKKSKTPFFRDIEKPFQEVTPIGPEHHQFFFFLEYLNKYDR